MEEYYGMKTLPRVMADKKTSKDITELENEVINVEQDLNSAGDNWYHSYNSETEEYEIRPDDSQASDIARRITNAIIRTDKQLKTTISVQQIRGLKKVKASLILCLRLVGMKELADAFDED